MLTCGGLGYHLDHGGTLRNDLGLLPKEVGKKWYQSKPKTLVSVSLPLRLLHTHTAFIYIIEHVQELMIEGNLTRLINYEF